MAVKTMPTPHRNGKGFLWSKEETARLLVLVKDELKRDEIGELLSEEFGTSRNADAVKRRLEALSPTEEKKAVARPRRDAWTPEQTQRAFELLASGKKRPAVTKLLNAEFHVKRTVKAVDEHLAKQRRVLKQASALAKTQPEAIVKASTREIASMTRGDRVVVPDGRAISVEFPLGQVRVLLQGELPLKAIRGLAEALVHAAIA